jgi:hypothetical protein
VRSSDDEEPTSIQPEVDRNEPAGARQQTPLNVDEE